MNSFLNISSEDRIEYASQISPPAHIHISGICGTGTSAVSKILKDLGFYITGSDKAFYPPISDFIKGIADKIYTNYQSQNLIKKPDLVVIGNSISKNNPEVEYILSNNIPFISMPEAFRAFLIKDKNFTSNSIVVVGTHGKSTTTASITSALNNFDLNPGYFVGAIPIGLNSNIRKAPQELPLSKRMVVLEGDEYDSAFFARYPKFLSYRPDIGIFTSLEFDHGDIFNSIEEIKQEFYKFIKLIPENGLALICDQYPNLLELAKKWKKDPEVKCKIMFYGKNLDSDFKLINRKQIQIPFDRVKDNNENHYRQELELSLQEKNLNIKTKLIGEHNALNLLATAGVCFFLNLDINLLPQALCTFSGLKRRQEVIYDKDQIIVIDDFAHHPSAVSAVIASVKENYQSNRIIAIFEFKSNTSRKSFFQHEYSLCFDKADLVLLKNISLEPGFSRVNSDVSFLNIQKLSQDIKDRGINVSVFQNVSNILKFLSTELKKGDIILIMSNGNFDGLKEDLLSFLKNKSESIN